MADYTDKEIEQIINRYKDEKSSVQDKSVEDVIMEIKAGIFSGTREERRKAGRVYPFADEVSLDDVSVSYGQKRKPYETVHIEREAAEEETKRDVKVHSGDTENASEYDTDEDTYQTKNYKVKSRLYGRVKRKRESRDYTPFEGKTLTHRQQFVKELNETADSAKKYVIELIFIMIFSAAAWAISFSGSLQRVISMYLGGQSGLFVLWCAVLAAVSLSGFDIFIKGFKSIRSPKPETIASAAMLTCVAEGAFGVFYLGNTSMYGSVACLTFIIIKYYEIQNCRIKAENIKAYLETKRPFVHEIINVENRQGEVLEMTAKVPLSQFSGHPKKIFEKGIVERFYQKYVPLALILGGVFAILSAVLSGKPQNAVSAFAALLCMASFGAIALSENIPFIKCQKKINHLGGAIIGRRALYEYSKSGVLAISDSDLFPKGSVKLYGMKFYGQHKVDDVLLYTSKTLSRIVPGISPSFSGIVERQTNIFEAPGDIKYYNNGGISVKFGFDNVLIGTLGFFASMGINVPMEVKNNFRNSEESAVLVSINSEFAGAFVLKYMPVKTVRAALLSLVKKGIEINVVSKDFNMSSELIERVYSLKDGYVRVSPIAESINLSDSYLEHEGIKSYGVSQRGSLPLFARTFLSLRRANSSVNSNLILTCAAAGMGTLILLYLFSKGALAQASSWNIFIYQVFWSVVLFIKPEFDR